MTATTTATIRPLRAGDDPAVRALFRATLALGRPAPFPLPAGYEGLCLDWYLGPGRDAAAVLCDHDGEVRGYVLVCLDEPAHRRWALPRAVAWAVRSAGTAARGGAEGAFVRHRAADALAARRAAPASPHPVHAHWSVARGARTGRSGRLLAAHVDRVCADHGLAGWYGEINAPAGRRAAALEHLGGRVVHRQRNATLSWLTGREVERLTVARDLAPAPLEPVRSVRPSAVVS